jgi:hypothetical protein
MGAGASALSPDAQAAIKALPEATQSELTSATVSAEALTTIKETLPTAVQAELEGLRIMSPSVTERVAAPVLYPFRWGEAIESVRECEGGDGTKLTLPKMMELSAALLDLPKLSTVEITGGTFELLLDHKKVFAEEGYTESFRALLRTEKQQRLAQLASLSSAEKRAMADAVCGCINDEHRLRVASTIGAILMGDVSSLVLDEALNVDVPPALEQLGKVRDWLSIPRPLGCLLTLPARSWLARRSPIESDRSSRASAARRVAHPRSHAEQARRAARVPRRPALAAAALAVRLRLDRAPR